MRSRHIEDVQRRLLDWYAHNGRDLPWRHTRDPYAVLVSEVMLQQTQVDRVIPKWRAWLAQFPTLAALAQATPADAIRAWQGLGYNRRAVRLHRIATQCVAEFAGELPGTVEGLLRLEGIGPYTAGAVACFGFGQPVAMVDTNVGRVLGRVFAGRAALRTTEARQLAESVVPHGSAYAWGQALMDLGATVCRAAAPMCLLCPLREVCPSAGRVDARLERRSGQGRFEDSSRYLRGRILDALRGLPAAESVEIEHLAYLVDPDSDARRVTALVEALIGEGLVARAGPDSVNLPT